jgi:pimeloyl-ACP methyl ester carboxylesterase
MAVGEPRFRVVRRGYAFRGCFIDVTERSPVGGEPAAELLLLHGRLANAGLWEPLVARLPGWIRATAIDFPGYGRSFSVGDRGLSFGESVLLADALIARMTRRPVILVGHDAGGAIAQACAIARGGEGVAGVVLMNSECLTSPPGQIPVGGGGFAARRLARRLGTLPEAAAYLLDQSLRRGPTRRPLLRAVDRLQRSWPGPEERGVWRSGISSFVRPVLMLRGARDPLVPAERAHEMFRGYPDAEYYELDGCGHWPAAEAPAWAAEKMTDFLFRVRSARKALSR